MDSYKEQKVDNELQSKGINLSDIITTALRVPGVKVDRETFLRNTFKHKLPDIVEKIILSGPISAGCTQEELGKIARKIISDRTWASTGASFVAGLPGGLAMAATIPGDLLQFYSVALRMAQELAYLYDEPDLMANGLPDNDKITNRLILYCGVMLGVSGAAQAVRIMASALAKQVIKKLPQKALTKTIYYPIVKSIAKVFGVKMTKTAFAKGISKAVPVIGGVLSGSMTFAAMKPMGIRLMSALEEAHFNYTEEEFQRDWMEVIEVCEEVETDEYIEDNEYVEATEFISPVAEPMAESSVSESPISSFSITDEIAKAKTLLDSGIITEDEFQKIKSALIAKL